MTLGAQLVWEFEGVDKTTAWALVEEAMLPSGRELLVRFGPSAVTAKRASKKLRENHSPYFVVEVEDTEVTFAVARDASVSVLRVAGPLVTNGTGWSLLRAAARTPSFVMGRLFDLDFDKWQNASNPLQYEAAGRSMDGLVFKSDPDFPNDRVIDTSGNPGRAVFRRGYLEATGHRMVLTPRFFERTGADPSRLETFLRESSANVSEHADCVLFSWDTTFRDDAGPQRALQAELRRLLFPHDEG